MIGVVSIFVVAAVVKAQAKHRRRQKLRKKATVFSAAAAAKVWSNLALVVVAVCLPNQLGQLSFSIFFTSFAEEETKLWPKK